MHSTVCLLAKCRGKRGMLLFTLFRSLSKKEKKKISRGRYSLSHPLFFLGSTRAQRAVTYDSTVNLWTSTCEDGGVRPHDIRCGDMNSV